MNHESMQPTKGLVVFVFAREGSASSNRYGGFAAKLQQAGALPGHDVLTVALENLAYIVEQNGGAQVIDTVSGVDIGTANFVYLKSWEAMPEEAAALAHYLSHKGVPCIDTLPLGMGVSKLVTAMRLWGQGLPVPTTLYIRRADRLLEYVHKHYGKKLGKTFIAKDIAGAKGKDNHLVTADQLADVLAVSPNKHFICQKFIENDGDYRLGVYFGTTRFVIKRIGSGDSHLNNISAGGRAEYIPVDKLDYRLARLAEKAAEASKLQVAGVDVIVDKHSGKPYILEVNQGSQIVSGAYVAENTAVFSQGINQAVAAAADRAAGASGKRVIGRRSYVSIPQLGIARGVAKVDTGAYTSTVHAENIRIEVSEDGRDELVFEIIPSSKLETVDAAARTVRVKDFFEQEIRSSNGSNEMRYSFRSDIYVQSQACPVVITLSDRSTMKNPILIGRRVLKDRFVVDVTRDEHDADGEITEEANL